MGNGLKPFKEQPLSFAYEPLISPPISLETENENLRVFSFEELKKATNKFRKGRVVTGEDRSVRTFYKGYIDDTAFAPSRTKTRIAVSVMECLQDSSEDLQVWKEEVKSLGKISHPNLVKFLGYCCEDNKSLKVKEKKKDNKSLLVFEDLHKGSLDHHIFGKEEALPWEIRVKIAIGTAQGLAFLHSIKNSPLHLELRMHNIMLDEHYNAKLFYLESNKQWLVDDTFVIVGKAKYLSPEFTVSGCVGKEADVYTFGVILLDLLTNLEVRTRSFLPPLNNKIGEIIDPRLGSDYLANAVTQMLTLIQRCTISDKKKRPLMQQVLDVLNGIAEIKD